MSRRPKLSEEELKKMKELKDQGHSLREIA